MRGVKSLAGRDGPERVRGIPKRARLAAVLSAFFLSSCAAPQPALRVQPVQAQAPTVRESRGRALGSEWERGKCFFGENRLSYADARDGRRGVLRVDVDVHAAARLHCSGQVSVIITQNSAVVTLGGDAVLEGREIFGMMGNSFTLANSYSLDLMQIDEEDGRRTGERLVGSRLSVSTASGRQWNIDLFDPSRWEIY
ncbi:MAG: hypothetical protein AB1324_03485 [Candidatus Micrarchaeota archaeon]